MANAFTLVRSWKHSGPVGKSLITLEGTLVIDTTATGGGTVDDLPASMFGLRKIVGPAVITADGEDKVFHAGPDYTGDSLLVSGIASAGVLVDLPNDTYRAYITGEYS